MEELAQNAAFRWYALSVAVLTLKMMAQAVYTGAARRRLKAYVNPEDAKMVRARESEREHPEIERIHRAFRNDFENVLPYFAVGLVFVVLGAGPMEAAAYFGVFTAARLVHTATYIRAMQPWRSIAYTAGLLSTLGMSVQIIVKAL